MVEVCFPARFEKNRRKKLIWPINLCSSFLFFSGGASVIARALFLSISIPRWCEIKKESQPLLRMHTWLNGFIFKACCRIRSTVFLKSFIFRLPHSNWCWTTRSCPPPEKSTLSLLHIYISIYLSSSEREDIEIFLREKVALWESLSLRWRVLSNSALQNKNKSHAL